MSFTGDYIDARTAFAWGLVNEVVPHEELLPRCLDIARSITQCLPDAVANLHGTYHQIRLSQDREAWEIEGRRSNEWMASSFDRERLAANREAIQRRGSGQV
jgi:enoyl-CoA hydratase